MSDSNRLSDGTYAKFHDAILLDDDGFASDLNECEVVIDAIKTDISPGTFDAFDIALDVADLNVGDLRQLSLARLFDR